MNSMCVFHNELFKTVSEFHQHSATKLQSKYINQEVSNIKCTVQQKMFYVQFYFCKLQLYVCNVYNFPVVVYFSS